MKIQSLAMAVAGMLLGSQAFGVNFTFLENGSNLSLGNSSTFVEGGVSLTAYGYAAPSTPSALYAKFTSGDASETGLGMTADSDHEINPTQYIQLDLQNLIAGNMGLGSIQVGENATIWGSNTQGSLGALQATLTGAGGVSQSYNLAAFNFRYVGVSASPVGTAANVLITGLSATSRVPDGGMTLMLLGAGLSALGLLRKKLMA